MAFAVSPSLNPLCPLRPEVEKVVDAEMLEMVDAVIVDASHGAGVHRDAGWESEEESNLLSGMALSSFSPSSSSSSWSLRVSRDGRPALMLCKVCWLPPLLGGLPACAMHAQCQAGIGGKENHRTSSMPISIVMGATVVLLQGLSQTEFTIWGLYDVTGFLLLQHAV